MIIDCHAHLPNRPLFEAMNYAEHWGIEKTCIFALGNEVDPANPAPGRYWPSTGAPHQKDRASPPPTRITPSNSLVMELLAESKGRLIGFCFVNPRYPNHALEEIHRCVAEGPLCGVKLWTACLASDPLIEPIAEATAKLGVPLLQHCWLKYGGNLPEESTPGDVATLARSFPHLNIIAAHLSGMQEEGISILAPYENVYLDTSGMAPDAGILDFAVAALGAHRILFGSDAPLRDPGKAISRITGTPLPPADRSKILGENFLRLISL